MKVHVVLDVEMCKVLAKKQEYPYKNEIIQIGAVMMNDAYEIIDQFSTYVRPQYGRVDHFIYALTGISERILKKAPYIEDALDQMLQWIGNKEPIFYSWSSTDTIRFDMKFIINVRQSRNGRYCLTKSIGLIISKKLGKRLGSLRLMKLKEALDLTEITIEGRMHK